MAAGAGKLGAPRRGASAAVPATGASLDYRPDGSGVTPAPARIPEVFRVAIARLPHRPAYIDTPTDVARFVDTIAHATELALDTEGASFHRFVDRIYLLQLSTRDKTAVIDPLPIGNPAPLGALLESPDVEVVFHDAD